MTTNFKPLLFAMAVFLGGCAAKPFRMTGEAYWPPIPDDPRIQYVESFYGTNYFLPQFSTQVADFFLGSDPGTILYKPFGVTADIRGNLYVSDGPGYVMMLDREGQAVRMLANSGQSKILGVGGLAFHNGRRELYIADSVRKSVSVIDPERNALLRMYAGEFSKPVSISLDEERDRLAVSDTARHDVTILNAKTGQIIMRIGGRGSEEGRFYYPLAVAYGPEGKLYVTDTMNFRVQVFDAEGKFVSTFGQIGMMPGQFSRPKGIGVDSEGHVYVADAAFGNVQVFDGETGDILIAFGAPGNNLPGEFSTPHNLFVDAQNRIYVVDQLHHRVQIFQYLKRDESKKLGATLRERQEKEESSKKAVSN